jgi:hypothetical protein
MAGWRAGWPQMAPNWARRCRWPTGTLVTADGPQWAKRCRWPTGNLVSADGPQWARRCRWPTGTLVSADGPQWAKRCRWPTGTLVSADGPQLGKTLQMADWHPCHRRWPTVGQDAADGRLATLSPQAALQRRHPRAGLDGAPPQTPQMGPRTPSALSHGKMDESGPLPTGLVTASEGRLSPPNEAVTLPTCRRFGRQLLARRHAYRVWI